MMSFAIANVLLNVVLISSFIVVFFFTYGAKVEGEIVKKQCTEIVNDLMADIVPFLPNDVKTNIASSLSAPEMADLDAKVAADNKALMLKTIKLIVIAFIIGLAIVVAMSVYFKFSIKDLLIHNAVMLVFVGMTEFVFLTFFAKNYTTIDSNYIKYKVLTTIKNYNPDEGQK